jgi:hypothetical protein
MDRFAIYVLHFGVWVRAGTWLYGASPQSERLQHSASSSFGRPPSAREGQEDAAHVSAVPGLLSTSGAIGS